MPRRTTALTAAALSLLPLGQPLLVGTLGFTAATAVVLHQGAAVAQDASAVARIAKAITVRIEGSTQGSGVIVKQEGNRYTVLTAWHVVRSNRPGEEVGIYTPDGKQHQLEQGSIQRLGQVDMAVLTFSSPGAYEVASVGDVKSVSSGNPIFVSGFPLPTSSVPVSIWRFLDGKVVANATVAIPDGYQLLYSNPTLPGMSGGSVLNNQGQLVGIHGQGETDFEMTEQSGVAVKTGTNQAVPISYYKQFNTGQTVVAANTQATSADDYLAQVKTIVDKKGQEREVIRLANQALSIQPSADGYYYRGIAKDRLKDYQGAIADLSSAIAIAPQDAHIYYYRALVNGTYDDGDLQSANADWSMILKIDPQFPMLDHVYEFRGRNRDELGDLKGAIHDFGKLLKIDPQNEEAWSFRASLKIDLEDYQGAITDSSKAIAINPQYVFAYSNRGNAKRKLGDIQGAIADYSKVIAIDPQDVDTYIYRGFAKHDLGDQQGACADYKKAVSLGDQGTAQWLNSEGAAWCRNM